MLKTQFMVANTVRSQVTHQWRKVSQLQSMLVEKSSSQTIAAITALTLFQVQLCVWIPL